MRTLRVTRLPGVPTPSGASPTVYEFHLHERDLRIEIPAEHLNPDVAIALHPDQARWLDRWPGLTQTWYCQWTFADRAALERFLAELELLLVEPAAAVSPPAPAGDVDYADAITVARSLGSGDQELVMAGGPAGNRVEVALVGDVVVSVGLCDGREEAWDIVARHGASAPELHALVAFWAKQFPLAARIATTRARTVAETLGAAAHRWVAYRHGGIEGATTRRILDHGGRVALETLGRRHKLELFATMDAAEQRLGANDVACGLSIPTAAELAAIAALGSPTKPRPRRDRKLAAEATFSQRLTEAFQRLRARRVLAVARAAGPQSHAWGLIAQARRKDHVGAVFFLAGHWMERATRSALHLYWASWDPQIEPLTFARGIVEALAEVGLEARPPGAGDESIVVREAGPRPSSRG